MPKTPKHRLDHILLDRGHAESREKAQRMIRAGQVRRGTDILDKPGAKFPEDIELDVRPLRDRFVGRGGWKLQAAFEAWAPALLPCPEVCADIGASTGGFTDCLLQNGAKMVFAIDVGRDQLDPRLADDPRVVVMENTNARYLKAGDLSDGIGLAVTDVSFISLRHILPPMRALLRRERPAQAVVLVKPQFEAGREHVGRGGVVRDPAIHREVLERVALGYAPDAGFQAFGPIVSPLRGPKGNREYLLRLIPTPRSSSGRAPELSIDAAVLEAFETASNKSDKKTDA